ncbi:hypothetical protein Y1Q_0000004 [Alligator mississippiensis]|uniref:Uncharacterized protein n=1 Tax=Alligator mississippiensis TaxID=8496 RepID=A0A151MWB7_ALLMI|nr:hypothetical protein Y1Q_0000004 [Alligator mississippiensis]
MIKEPLVLIELRLIIHQHFICQGTRGGVTCPPMEKLRDWHVYLSPFKTVIDRESHWKTKAQAWIVPT